MYSLNLQKIYYIMVCIIIRIVKITWYENLVTSPSPPYNLNDPQKEHWEKSHQYEWQHKWKNGMKLWCYCTTSGTIRLWLLCCHAGKISSDLFWHETEEVGSGRRETQAETEKVKWKREWQRLLFNNVREEWCEENQTECESESGGTTE